jgi:hypothetical protein
MTKSKLLGAAAVLIVAMASPAMAQEAIQEPGVYTQTYPWAAGRSGFRPGDVAAGIVGGAIGTADATAPVRGADSYACYGGGRIDDDSYAHYGDRPVSRRTTCGPAVRRELYGARRPLVSLLGNARGKGIRRGAGKADAGRKAQKTIRSDISRVQMGRRLV